MKKERKMREKGQSGKKIEETVPGRKGAGAAAKIEKEAVAKSGQKENEPADELMMTVARAAYDPEKARRTFSEEEIAEIENGLTLKQKDAKAYDRHKAAKRAKKEAVDFECDNRDKFIIFPSFSKGEDEKWGKAVDFSALFYVNVVAPGLGKKARIFYDRDNYNTAEYSVSIRDLPNFVKEATAFLRVRPKTTEHGVIIFHLKRPATKEEVGAWRRAVESERLYFSETIKPAKTDTATYQIILALIRMVGAKLGRIEKGYKRISEMMLEDLHEIIHIYHAYSDGLYSKEDSRRMLLGRTDKMLAILVVLSEARLVPARDLIPIGMQLTELKNAITTRFNKPGAAGTAAK